MFQRAGQREKLYTPQEVYDLLEVTSSEREDVARQLIRADPRLWRSAARDAHTIWGDRLINTDFEEYIINDDILLAQQWDELWGVTTNLVESSVIAKKLGLPKFLGSRLENTMLSLLSSGIAFRRRVCETDIDLGLTGYERYLVRMTSPKPDSEHYLNGIFGSLEALIIAASDYYTIQTRLCELYTQQTGKNIERDDVHSLRRQIIPRVVRAATGKKIDYHTAMTHFLRSNAPVSFSRPGDGRLIVTFGELPSCAEEFFRACMTHKDPDFLTFLDSSTLHTGCPMLQAKLDGKTFLTRIANLLADSAERDMVESTYGFGAHVPSIQKQPLQDLSPQ